MDPISLTASIVAILQATGTIVQFINDIQDSRQDRINLRNELSSVSFALQMLRERIDQEQKGLDGGDPSWLSSVLMLGIPMGPLEQFEDVLAQLEKFLPVADEKGNKLKRLGKALNWPFQKADVDKYLRILERQKSMFYLALQNDNLSLAQAIKEDTCLLPEVADKVKQIAVTVDKLHLSSYKSENRTIVGWLSPINFFPTHEDIFRRREPGTGQWFIDSPEFQSWVHEKTDTLWCPGIPGAGKTILSSIIVDYLRSQFGGNDSIGVASIYLNYKGQIQQTPVNLLAALWMQIMRRNDLSKDVINLYEKHIDQDTRPTITDVMAILKRQVSKYQRVYVIVDALDECPEDSRVELLEHIRTFQPSVRLLATSRPYDSIGREFAGQKRLEIKASNKDVRSYIAGRLLKGSRLARLVGTDPSLAQYIEKVVVGNAQNMFLLAQLHMDSLQSKSSSKAVRQTLHALPKDLDGTYEEALRRIEDQTDDDKELAYQILQWLSFAVRPLELNELQEALAVEPETQELDKDNINDVDLITSVCAGLVVFDRDSEIIRLVHFSTQEYFRRIRGIRFPRAQKYIGQTCLEYLCFDEFESGPCSDDSSTISRIQSHHLLPYAAEHWGDHVRGAAEKGMEREVLGFLKQNSKVSTSVQVMHFNPKKNWYVGESTRFPRNVTGLQLVAHFGLDHVASILIGQGVDISAIDSFGTTALHRAAEAGCENMVRLLLDSGADIEAKDAKGHTALHQAAKGGSIAVVQLLLGKGAKISETLDGRTALHFAAEARSEAIAALLIENGAEVTVESKTVGNEWQKRFYSGRTPLHWAAASGSDPLVRLLLERGAKVNALNISNRTPLQEAIMNKHVEVAKTLLENGASVTVMDDNHWTPLHEAAWQSPPVMSEILLDYKANINAQNKIPDLSFPEIPKDDLDVGNGGLTPLQLAAVSGRFDVFEVLKTRGANLESIDAFGFTTIHRAVQGNSVDVIRSLLNAGVNVNTRGGVRNETPLHRAARQGMTECILYLLEQGADIEARDAEGNNAIQIAETAGKEDAVRALLQYKSLEVVEEK